MFYTWFGDLVRLSGLELRLTNNIPKLKELGLKPMFIPICQGMKASDFCEVWPCEVCPIIKFNECWNVSF